VNNGHPGAQRERRHRRPDWCADEFPLRSESYRRRTDPPRRCGPCARLAMPVHLPRASL